MATSDTFRALLLAVLDKPKDLTPGLALADWLQEQGHPRAEVIRRSFNSKCAYITEQCAFAGEDGNPPVVDIVIQLVPQRVAVEFASRCVEAVMDNLEEVFPVSDDRPRRLLAAIRAWAGGRGTKRAVAEAEERFNELRRQAAADPDHDDAEDDDERDAIGQAWSAADALSGVAASVKCPPNSPQSWNCISGSLIEAYYSTDNRNVRAWRRRQLARLIRERDLGM